MCGIAGIWNFNNSKIEYNNLVRFTDYVSHRGPDGSGYELFENDTLGLGHRRLSILDVSENGKQPMSYDNGRYWITLNGEIYNFIEIREELKQNGEIFKSESDTEVVLAAFKVWGKEMLHKFNGMWAFAIYDKLEKSLFLSRDRFGVKPLYYFLDKEQLIFSSEIHAIHKLLGDKLSYNKSVIENILQGGFNYHGTSETYLSEVNILPGGYNLEIKNGQKVIEEWYQLPKVKVPKSFEEQAKKLRELLIDACKLRMRSDVSIATCLSGGVDSGAITAIINTFNNEENSRFNNYTHKGFCAAFPNTPLDESADAVRLAKQLNSQIDVLEIKAPTQIELENAMQHCDGPMHALAFFPVWNLYKHIKESGVTVTLDGQGPDEMLGGYRPIYEALSAAMEMKKPKWFYDVYKTYSSQGETSQFSSKAYSKKIMRMVLKQHSQKFKYKAIQLAKLPLKTVYKLFRSYTPNTAHIAEDSNKLKWVRNAEGLNNLFDKSLYSQFFQYPLPGILQTYDRCSMANGVECRMPFMDYRVVEFIFSLPVESKVGDGYTKRILREAVKGLLPDETRLNKKKIGFNAPIVDWYNNELKNFMLQQMSKNEYMQSTHFDGKLLKSNFEAFLKKNQSQDSWNEAWQFWPSIHLTWYIANYNN
jgi:asparagine synthase (glutamine-hydrolysing)